MQAIAFSVLGLILGKLVVFSNCCSGFLCCKLIAFWFAIISLLIGEEDCIFGPVKLRRSSPNNVLSGTLNPTMTNHLSVEIDVVCPLALDKMSVWHGMHEVSSDSPLTSNRHHLSYDACLENKGRLQDCSCSIGIYHCIQCYAHIL